MTEQPFHSEWETNVSAPSLEHHPTERDRGPPHRRGGSRKAVATRLFVWLTPLDHELFHTPADRGRKAEGTRPRRGCFASGMEGVAEGMPAFMTAADRTESRTPS